MSPRPTMFKALIVRDGDARCAYCATPLTEQTWTRDHVVPVSLGGGSHFDNSVMACEPCNSAKGHLMLAEWRPDIESWGNRTLDHLARYPTDGLRHGAVCAWPRQRKRRKAASASTAGSSPLRWCETCCNAVIVQDHRKDHVIARAPLKRSKAGLVKAPPITPKTRTYVTPRNGPHLSYRLGDFLRFCVTCQCVVETNRHPSHHLIVDGAGEHEPSVDVA